MEQKSSTASSSSTGRYHYDEYLQQRRSDAGARPSLGFPLGTALLLVVIFSLSGVFSCCYHWDKLRALRRRRRGGSLNHLDIVVHHDDVRHYLDSPSKPKPNHLVIKPDSKLDSVTVIMPGDDVPRFIAMPCRCQPPRPPPLSTPLGGPPKPPTMVTFPVPPYI